jgi:gas vesicle protein
MSDSGSEIGAFMAGFVIGGLVGAATALILAPQSGEATRTQLASKSQELREVGMQQYEAARVRVQDSTLQAQEQARIVLDEGKSKFNTAYQRGKETMAEAQEEASLDEPAASEDDAA